VLLPLPFLPILPPLPRRAGRIGDRRHRTLEGVVIKSLRRYEDPRGWLVELFRDDELPQGFDPVMGYISLTRPGVTRGPHEHRDQTDGFAFLDGVFELHLWENRPSRTPERAVYTVGRENPVFVTVPPGVVHAYRNVGDTDALVLNFPDRLYAGQGKAEPVDEIRHEDDPDSRFAL
jgi:dTDP-4-dehydrorhamnose 3,5-epimerase